MIFDRIQRKVRYYWYESQYRILRWYWDKSGKQSKMDGYAIVYHHVTDENVDIIPSCICKVPVFEKTIKEIVEEGRKVVSPKEAIHLIKSHSTFKFAVITFDDVPSNFMENAYPILKQYNIPFTLFVTIKFLTKEGYLNIKQIVELSKDPLCTIGGHTISHKKMRYNKESFRELIDSKAELEKIIGREVDSFAYPFGRQSTVSHKNVKEVKKAGYCCAFSTIDVHFSDASTKNLFFLPRIVVN